MKKLFLLFAAFFFAVCIFSCSNSAGGGGDAPTVTTPTDNPTTPSGGESQPDSGGGTQSPTNPTGPGTQDPAAQQPEPVYCSVTFVANNEAATGTMDGMTALKDSAITLAANGFSLDGYVFTGWNTKGDGSGVGYADCSNLKLEENLTLYAQWLLATVPTYEIEVASAENGIVSASAQFAAAGSIVTINLSPNDEYEIDTLAVTAESGNAVGAIADANNNTVYSFTMPEEKVCVSAAFKLKRYTVTFETGCSTQISAKIVESGQKVSAVTLQDIASECSGFDGWYAENDLANKFDFNSPIKQDVVLFAKWNAFYVTRKTIIEKINSLRFSACLHILKADEAFGDTWSSDFIYEVRVALCRLKNEWYLGNKGLIRVSLDFRDCDISLDLSYNNSKRNGAFEDCMLDEVYLPSKVTLIGMDAFVDTGLKKIYIPYGVTTIEVNAFGHCPLKKVEIPSSVTLISAYAFTQCPLEELTIPFVGWKGTATVASEATLFGFISTGGYTGRLTNVKQYYNSTSSCDYYVSKNLKKVTVTGGKLLYGAFSGCDSIEEIELKDGVTSIGEAAFMGCSSLKKVNIPSGITSISANTFKGCSSLEGITIPNTVTSIGENAFMGCSALKSIEIPSSVTSIGKSAFNGCSALEEMKIPFIGGTVNPPSASETTLFGYVFGDEDYSGAACAQQNFDETSSKNYYIPVSLKKVTVTGGKLLYGAFSGCGFITDLNLPSGITSIPDMLLYNCNSLKSVSVPNIVASIGKSAFCNCSSLKNFDIPADVASVGENAFRNCSSLEKIEIPNKVKTLPEGVFFGCSSLKEMTIPFVGKSDYTADGRFGSVFGAESYPGSVCVQQQSNYSNYSDYYIPESLKKITVTGGNLFFGAFSGCGMIETIDARQCRVTNKSTYAFSKCSSLTSVQISSAATIIASGMFAYCTSLETVNIPNGITKIDAGAFRNCEKLKNINIPSGVTEIGGSAFWGCSALGRLLSPTE